MSTNYIDQITDTAGTTHDISEGDSTRIFRATCSTAASTAAKVATLDTSNRNFSLASGVRVAVTFTYGNTATTPTLRVDGSSTGTAKNMAVWADNSSILTGGGTTYFYWGPYETIIFTYDGTRWVIGQGGAIYKAYALANSKTSNTGTVTQVTAGTGLSIGTTAGGNFTTSGTINHTNSVTAQTTQAVYPIKIDAQGHISAYGSAVTSMPASDVSSWAKASSKPSYTASEVGAAASSHTHGDITNAGDITTTATIANGDRLVINDESASKVTNSSITFGTSTSQYLANNGTWQNVPSVPTKTSDLTNDSGFINSIKTINNQSLIGSGDITVSTTNTLLYGICNTAADTVAKTATIDSSFELVEGATIAIKFTNANTATNPTLNINNTGAKAIKRYGNTDAGIFVYTSWSKGEVVPLLYDGTYWQIMYNMAQDHYVTQTYSTNNNNYNLALSSYTNATIGVSNLNHSTKIKGNPSTGRITTEDMTSQEVDDFVDSLNISGTSILNMFYPVGSIYQTIDDGFNPNIRWGGTWELIEEGRFLQATETSATGGDTVSAGLPNIGGHLDIRATDYNASPVAWADGVFIKSTTAGYSVDAVHQQNGAVNVIRYNFDAHYYNSIYGNSTTVQPSAVKVYMWHRTA